MMCEYVIESNEINNYIDIAIIILLNINSLRLIQMKSCINPPPSSENLKLKEKSEMITSVTHASQRSYKLHLTKPIKYLNIQYFKLHPCTLTRSHPHKQCMNYHNAKDHKRYGNFYCDRMCHYIERGQQCQNGQQCTYAHSYVQQLYQQQNYKKKFCTHYPNNIDKCQYGDYCSFAHSEQEIRIQLIHNYTFDEDFYMFHYKTEYCPFNLTQHDKKKCVYAHNLQDYRRSPVNFYYQPVACPNWNLQDRIYQYYKGCEKGLECTMCHGWKQLQYHPNYYRINKCNQSGCKKGECSNYHSEKQRRIVQEEVGNFCFRYVPRNRICKGIFKQYDEQQYFEQSKQFKSSKQKAYKSMMGILQPSPTKPHNSYKTELSNKILASPANQQSAHNNYSTCRYLPDQELAQSDEDQSLEYEHRSQQEHTNDIIGQVQKLILDQ